ncbi:Hypothetical protein DPCES_4467 [Desulfitobacterium hafniense]|uniref:Uncharacterized protein n=1 Tax=Desulfitobacterium hafniense TaxID=49338 RepID=A0A098B653_DESHA|nr:Hypothetical protein DPCES_4467 [Desulfitobacterium hafniense]
MGAAGVYGLKHKVIKKRIGENPYSLKYKLLIIFVNHLGLGGYIPLFNSITDQIRAFMALYFFHDACFMSFYSFNADR